MERTLSIIKPDAVEAGHTGAIIDHLIKGGLRPVAMKLQTLTTAEAEGFYAVHRARPFFGSLVAFMTRGPIVVMVLEGDGAITKNRELMGATDSKKAAAGTIRAKFGIDIEQNAVHGSDGLDTAKFEIGYFFAGHDLI